VARIMAAVLLERQELSAVFMRCRARQPNRRRRDKLGMVADYPGKQPAHMQPGPARTVSIPLIAAAWRSRLGRAAAHPSRRVQCREAEPGHHQPGGETIKRVPSARVDGAQSETRSKCDVLDRYRRPGIHVRSCVIQ